MGLHFHEPQSFLLLGNYAWSIERAPKQLAIAFVVGGVVVALFGYPLRHLSGAIVGGALGVIVAGCCARSTHVAFLPSMISGALAGALLGFGLPRTMLGLALGTAAGLAIRTFFIAFGLGEYAFEAFAGGVVVSYVLSLLAPSFWIVTMSAMCGTIVALLAALPLAGVTAERATELTIALGVGWTAAFLLAMAVQLRIGPLHLKKKEA